MIEYRIKKSKNNLYYPQYKKFLIWRTYKKYEVRYLFNFIKVNVWCTTFEAAKQYIDVEKSKIDRFKSKKERNKVEYIYL